jgi:hypothetical protein
MLTDISETGALAVYPFSLIKPIKPIYSKINSQEVDLGSLF